MSVENQDLAWMQRALLLAERGRYTTRPNPAVGCVIVRSGRMVGEGFHVQAGEPHAEIHALQQAGAQARGADVYVTLEPCAHTGRTGPCVQALIDAQVRRVVIAIRDPNPKAQGGCERLRQAGIEVCVGVCEREARELNIGFFHAMRHQRPFVRCKLAMSVDGHTALANGESVWITGKDARESVQGLRAQSGALITGIGTILKDNPKLNIRSHVAAPSVRVIMDRDFRLPPTAQVLQEPGEIWWIGASDAKTSGDPAILRRCTRVLQFPREGRQALVAVLDALYEAQIWEVLIEAGPELAGRFFESGLLDELWVYGAPCFMGVSAKPLLSISSPDTLQAITRWKTHALQRLDEDICWVMRPGFERCLR